MRLACRVKLITLCLMPFSGPFQSGGCGSSQVRGRKAWAVKRHQAVCHNSQDRYCLINKLLHTCDWLYPDRWKLGRRRSAACRESERGTSRRFAT